MQPIRVVATYLLFLSFSTNLVVLVSPALYKIYENTSENSPVRSFGFWPSCDCVWYSSNNIGAVNLDIPKFAKELWLHWLYIGSVSIMNFCLFSWFILTFFAKKVVYVAMTIIGVFMLVAAGLAAATITIFAIKAHSEAGVSLTGETKFDWAMWLSIPACGLATLTALVFIIQGPSLYRSQKDDRRDM